MRLRHAAAILSALALFFAAACDGGSGKNPVASPTHGVATTATPANQPLPGSGGASPAFDGHAAFAHVRALADDIGPRPAGSEAERTAAEYLRKRFESAGYRAELQQFTFRGDGFATIEIDGKAVATGAPMRGGSLDTVSGRIQFIGLGQVTDTAQVSLRGAIALADRGTITFEEKARNAANAGAAGIIVINQTSAPLFGSLSGSHNIPIIGVSGAERDVLMEATKAGAQAALIFQGLGEQRSQNVVAQPPSGECAIVVGGHYDSVPAGPGANDNASGAAVVLAIAEARAAQAQHDGVCYVAFGAEEVGLSGSQHYVRQLNDTARAALTGMINLDMVGVGDRWLLIGSRSLRDLAAGVAAENEIAAQSADLPQQFDSDHSSFTQQCIPAVFLNRMDDPNYHTPNDRAEHVKPELLQEAGTLSIGLITRLLEQSAALSPAPRVC